MPENQAREIYLRWRSGFVLKLAIYHFVLILVFDLFAIYLPSVFSSPIVAGSVYSIGLVFAMYIVASVIASTFYYSYRITAEESKFLSGIS